MVVARTPSPMTASRTRLRPRACSGFGRVLRGTAQMVLDAYWNACATPSAPYTDAIMLMITPVGPPLRCSGLLSSEPTTGNDFSAPDSSSFCRCWSPRRTTLSTVDAISSSGNSDTKA